MGLGITLFRDRDSFQQRYRGNLPPTGVKDFFHGIQVVSHDHSGGQICGLQSIPSGTCRIIRIVFHRPIEQWPEAALNGPSDYPVVESVQRQISPLVRDRLE